MWADQTSSPHAWLTVTPAVPHARTGDAIERFLSRLVPSALNVYHSSRAHAADCHALQRERWYGAQYAAEPLSPALRRRLSDMLLPQASTPLQVLVSRAVFSRDLCFSYRAFVQAVSDAVALGMC